MAKHDKYHGEHFAAIGQLKTETGALAQRLGDHEDYDDDRFGLIQRGIETIQEDIKELLRRQK